MAGGKEVTIDVSTDDEDSLGPSGSGEGSGGIEPTDFYELTTTAGRRLTKNTSSHSHDMDVYIIIACVAAFVIIVSCVMLFLVRRWRRKARSKRQTFGVQWSATSPTVVTTRRPTGQGPPGYDVGQGHSRPSQGYHAPLPEPPPGGPGGRGWGGGGGGGKPFPSASPYCVEPERPPSSYAPPVPGGGKGGRDSHLYATIADRLSD